MQPTNPSASNQSVWDGRYRTEEDSALSWTEPPESVSFQWITAICSFQAEIADVGAGRSILLDQLLKYGYSCLTHVEWSEAASLDVKARLGDAAAGVNWYVGDVCEWKSESPIDFWHDRAVFHFQTTESAKRRYLQKLNRNLAPGGFALIATFHNDGPSKCSGLAVARYDAVNLFGTLNQLSDSPWILVQECVHPHQTPTGATQLFQYVLAKRGDV